MAEKKMPISYHSKTSCFFRLFLLHSKIPGLLNWRVLQLLIWRLLILALCTVCWGRHLDNVAKNDFKKIGGLPCCLWCMSSFWMWTCKFLIITFGFFRLTLERTD